MRGPEGEAGQPFSSPRLLLRIRSLKGSPGRVVLPNGTYLLRVWARHTPCHGFLPGLAHVTLRVKRAKARRDMAEGLRPPPIPLSTAAIGRLPSRMPVIIRSP